MAMRNQGGKNNIDAMNNKSPVFQDLLNKHSLFFATHHTEMCTLVSILFVSGDSNAGIKILTKKHAQSHWSTHMGIPRLLEGENSMLW